VSLTELEAEAPTPGSEPEQSAKVRGRSPWQLVWARLRTDKVAIVAIAVILLFVLAALLAPLIASWVGWGPEALDRVHGTTSDGLPVAPNGRHPFGTDNLGRDILVRVIYGSRVSLLVGILATLIATTAGVIIGTIAGYFGGATDTVLSRFMDVTLAFPYLLFAIALAAAFGASISLTIAIIAFFSFAQIGRIVRGQILSIKEREFVEAARSLGAGNLRIMFVDMLPNLVAPITVLASLTIPTAIIFESTLSFLGAGTDPRTASWGNMLSNATDYYQVAWWTLAFPAAALLVATLAFNLLGDAVRDAIDPRSERIFAAQKARRRSRSRRAEVEAK
jgi:peptide/nickel transport system permease protein